LKSGVREGSCVGWVRNKKKWFACVTSGTVGKYPDIFARESVKSAIKQLSHLHYAQKSPDSMNRCTSFFPLVYILAAPDMSLFIFLSSV
jgi:hypothetical protein